jgi:ABC-2 type transport system permease protein
VFMITAWTYCLRGWLAAIMTNQRRRRAVIFGVTAAFVLLGQTPNIYFNVVHRHGRSERQNRTTTHSSEAQKQARKTAGGEQLTKLLAAQKFVPPLWLPLGAHALAEGRPLPALFGAMGCFGIGALGLHRAYRLTMRFYRGETDRKRAPQAKAEREAASAPVRQSAGFLELAIPKVPEQATALALTTLRSMLRAPEVKMAWASSFVITIIAIVTFGFRADSAIPAMARPFIATGAAALSLFALMQFAANQFGFDREGFRALVLSPAERRLILVGKNLAILPIGATPGGLVVLPAAIWLKLPPLTTVAAIFQLATMLLLMGMLGNLLSTLVPYRIQAGSIKPTKMPAVRMLVVFFSHALFPVVIAPVFIPPLAELLCQVGGWSRAVPVNLLLSIALAALAAWAYWRSLGPLGRLLQQREKNILDAVTAEVE